MKSALTYMYQAYPLAQEDEPIDITRLHSAPAYALFEAFPKWTLMRGRMEDNNSSVKFNQYFIEAGQPIREVVTEIDNDETDEEQLDRVIEEMRQKAENTDFSSLPEATTDASVAIVVALEYLKPHLEEFAHEFRERRDAMTREEKLMERAQKYSWIVEPPAEKIKQMQWWIIGDCMAPLIYAVRAKSPDFAAAILDEHYANESGFGLSMFNIDPLEDEYLERFETQFAHPEVELVRLIPFSRVPWPEDPSNPTPEQQEAFDRLKR